MSDISRLRSLIAQGHDLLREGSPNGPDGYGQAAGDIQARAGALMPEFRSLYRDTVAEAKDVVAALLAEEDRERIALAALAEAD